VGGVGSGGREGESIVMGEGWGGGWEGEKVGGRDGVVWGGGRQWGRACARGPRGRGGAPDGGGWMARAGCGTACARGKCGTGKGMGMRWPSVPVVTSPWRPALP